MAKKMNHKTLIPFIFIIPLSCWIIWDFSIQEMIQMEDSRNKFCENKGYIESTDYHETYDILLVECDNQHIFYGDLNVVCLKSDKWGDCLENGYEVK